MIDRETYTRLLLLGIAAHSLLTGVGLLLQPGWLIAFGGWRPLSDPFFPAQGGIFHVLMAVLYGLAARRAETRSFLLPFIVFVKAAAAVFLVSYYLAVEQVWLVLLSGLLDGAMAVLVFLVHRDRRTSVIRTLGS